MKRGFLFTLTAMLAVLAVVFCILYISGNQDKDRKIDSLSANIDTLSQNVRNLESDISLRNAEIENLNGDLLAKDDRIHSLEAESAEAKSTDAAGEAPAQKPSKPADTTANRKKEANKKRSKRYVKGAQKKEEPREQDDTFRL